MLSWLMNKLRLIQRCLELKCYPLISKSEIHKYMRSLHQPHLPICPAWGGQLSSEKPNRVAAALAISRLGQVHSLSCTAQHTQLCCSPTLTPTRPLHHCAVGPSLLCVPASPLSLPADTLQRHTQRDQP